MRVAIATCVSAALAALAAAKSPWPPSAFAAAQATLAKMNLTNKLTMVHGWGGAYVGDVPEQYLSDGTYIPPMHHHDGPQGVANGNTDVTCWPSALTVVQSWDPELMAEYGAGMGLEQYKKGTNFMLGPGVNLARLPWNGRNFEYQGEDPWLASKMVAAEIWGIQSQNISGCVKHYTFNNEETDRSGMSSNVDQRPAKELYFKPFAAAVDAGVGSAMCSYNRVNGTWACEDANALNEIKQVQGFGGFMMSDWGATHSTLPAALNGLDQQMPDNSYFGPALAAAVAAGTLPMSRLDDMVLRMLTPMYALNLFADPPNPALRNTSSPARTPAHDALARKLAQGSITLLKNNGLLPVSPEQLTGASVAIFGDTDTVSGGGSGSVVRPYVISPAAGVSTFLNGAAPPPQPGQCTQEQDVDYFQNGSPSTQTSNAAGCCDACANNAGCRSWTFTQGTCYMKPDASGRRPAPGLISGNCTSPPAPLPSGPVNVTYYSTQDATAAAAAAAGAALVIMVVATDSSEGSDRAGLGLPAWQDAMVASLAAANPNLVVVARCPGACTMPWAAAVPAILFELLPGQESGNSIANTIFGANNPSGRLPVTFPNPAPAGQQYPTDTWLSPVGGGPVIPTRFPGTDRGRGFPEVDFDEGLFMGYRWYDQQKTSPQWPFGHGLSYSTFTYSNLAVVGTVTPTASATVYATVCNTAGPAGAEVVQLYVGYPDAANEPPKQLKGFQKVGLASDGGCGGVGFPIEAKDLWTWDVTLGWQLIPGTYQIYVGSTSRDIRLTGTLTVSAQ